ncbi:hypothetical protein [Pseudomarimonas arenosa]|uniref:Uncharacterized protein n=1 Tax=Pseudomarimonas arenosa TaxID=2774145 RepID=A0AAW3ZNA8_9GAMM|nr:hypothetical protein [Pseudomarimonas arenosa]MBD8527643.1 hypothetical protein [Pseudomarimonas arenosa]
MSLVVGSILLIGMIGIVIAAFRVSLPWGLLTLLVPATILLFVPLHWRESKGPMMILLVGLAFAGVTAVASSRQQAADHPQIIANPTYLELRGSKSEAGRDLEQVFLLQAVDATDCQQQAKRWQAGLSDWQLSSPSCSTSLPPRFAPLFANQRAGYPYLSVARRTPHDREIRVVLWGYSSAEADLVCKHGKRFEADQQHPVDCIRP